MEEIKQDIKEIGNELEERKKKLINLFKKGGNWIYYTILAGIIFVSTYIRTLNLSKLKDITTGTWTLGPDLDPFLFLRWAQYIAEHGKLFLLDTMRSVPLANICSGDTCNAINTAGEMKLLSYMIVWLNQLLSIFDKEVTVTYAAVILPVIMSVLAGIAFFLFARKLFYKENKNVANIIALVSTAFFVLIPSLLPRTIAGIPEKESAAFFFMFIAFYFFLEAFTSEKIKRGLVFGTLAGVATGLLGLIWGGVGYAIMTIAGAVFLMFLLNKIDVKKFYFYSMWVIGFLLFTMPFSIRYSPMRLIESLSTGLMLMVLLILLVDFLLIKKKVIKLPEKWERILSHPMVLFAFVGFFFIILSSIVFGVSFIPNKIHSVIDQVIYPITPGRFSVTVAENKPSYFVSDWKNDFGPVIFEIPLYFWMLVIGAVMLFNNLITSMSKREKRIMTASYFVLLICLIFSKYAPHPHPLDGEGSLSLLVYFGGVLFFIGSFAYFAWKKHKARESFMLEEINFGYILYFILLTMTIIGARGAVRLIMVLGAISPIAVAFLIVKSIQKYLKEKEEFNKLLTGILVLIVLISSMFTMWSYYQNDVYSAQNYAPTMYTQQWQKAMAWVRDNTPTTAVFAHWWDYGYWLQSIGERATILDGGNAIGYWNYFMGRYVLTGTDEQMALNFLYAHNGTHLLIDSTEIGKYSAFSSIGSNAEYDRYSWIPTILLDETQTQEKNNETMLIYPVGVPLDEDLILNENGKDVLLPQQSAGVAAIAIKEGKNKEILQPIIFFVYNGKQYQQPLKNIYLNGKLYEFESGFDAGIFIFPKLEIVDGGRVNMVENGAALYLSKRVIHSQLATLYLFNRQSSYFKLAYTGDNLIMEDLKNQGVNNLGDFVYYQGFQGPIKIWQVSYPSGMSVNQTYLDLEYPAELETINKGY
jgi:asparagine N-glycosylation enzyme membrane subunit Stt3